MCALGQAPSEVRQSLLPLRKSAGDVYDLKTRVWGKSYLEGGSGRKLKTSGFWLLLPFAFPRPRPGNHKHDNSQISDCCSCHLRSFSTACQACPKETVAVPLTARRKETKVAACVRVCVLVCRSLVENHVVPPSHCPVSYHEMPYDVYWGFGELSFDILYHCTSRHRIPRGVFSHPAPPLLTGQKRGITTNVPAW